MQSSLIKWLKNIVIIALSALCVYQTGNLWFDEPPGLNDFLNLLGIERAPLGYGEALDGLTRPKRILVSEGGGVFTCNYSDIERTAQYQSARSVLLSVLGSNAPSRVLSSDMIPWHFYLSSLVRGEAIIFDYGFNMPSDAFTVALGGNSPIISDGIDYFNMVLFIPRNDSAMRVVFLDTLSVVQAACEFYVTHSEPIDFGGLPNPRNLVYTAVTPPGGNPGSLLFMPQSLPGGAAYSNIRQQDPQNARDFLPLFFDDPGTARNEPFIGGGHMFVDPDTTVSLTNGLFLDYRSWRRGAGRTDSFAAAYAAAIIFMRRDIELINEIYLERYEYDSGSYIFYFNYVFQDFPVHLSNSLKNTLDALGACIEVTVEWGRVSRYRRYMVQLEERHVSDRPEISADAALRELELHFWGTNHNFNIGYMDLAYFLDIANPVTGLSFNVYHGGVFIPLLISN
jgi:hypothetical protein